MNLHDEKLFSLEIHHDLRQPVMCNMSKSCACHVWSTICAKTDSTASRVKNDLKSAWICPRSSRSDAPLHSRRHCSKLHALQTCPWHSLVPTIDLSAQTSQCTRHFVKHHHTTCAACIPTSFWVQARSTWCTLNSGCLVSPLRLDAVGIIRDVSTCQSQSMFSTSCQSQSMFSTFSFP